jgi:tetratricopeptide (TPR) repeat protein
VESIIELGEDEASSVVGDTEHQLRRLIQTLRNREGRFALIFAVCNDSALRKALVREVANELRDQDVAELQITPTDFGLLDKMLQMPGAPQPLFVYGLEHLLPSSYSGRLRREETLQELQLRREQFRTLGRPVVLWMPEYVYTLIGQHAVDFWSWQSGTFFFTEIQSRKVGIRGRNEEGEGPSIDLQRFEVTEESLEEHHQAILDAASRASRNRLKQLPALTVDFIGREKELSNVRRVLQDPVRSRTLVVHGAAGTGKTALLLKVAQELKASYGDGGIFLDLRDNNVTVQNPTDVMWHVITSLTPLAQRGDDGHLATVYNNVLCNKRLILFLDNADNLEDLTGLFPPEGSILLITSRHEINQAGVFKLGELDQADAEALLTRFNPQISDLAKVIARRCAYLPLPMRVVAATLRYKHSLGLSSFLERLDEKRTYEYTINSALNVTYELLNKRLRRGLRTLAVFPVFFDASAAAVIWEAKTRDGQAILNELKKYGLVEAGSDPRRFRLHDSVKNFVEERMKSSERYRACYRHSAYYLHILKTANSLYLAGGDHIEEGLSLFDTEQSNIEAGQQWSALAIKDKLCARLCVEYADAGRNILSIRKHPRELIRWELAALEAANLLGDPTGQATRLGNLGSAYAAIGEASTALYYYERALVIARQIEDRQGQATNLGNLGSIHAFLGDLKRAITYYEQALRISVELEDRRSEAKDLERLGSAYLQLGEPKIAIDYHNRALGLNQQIGNRWAESSSLSNLGNDYLALGEVEQAIEYYKQGLQIARETRDKTTEAMLLAAIGTAFSHRGQIERAIDYYGQALVIARGINNRRLLAFVLGSQGRVALIGGHIDLALQQLAEALAIAYETDNLRDQGTYLASLSDAYSAMGDKDKAMDLIANALAILEQIKSPAAEQARRTLSRLRKGDAA